VSIHALKSSCCHCGWFCNDDSKSGRFGFFPDGFKSWFTSSFMMEVMPQSDFGFLVLHWVGWIHLCTEMMLAGAGNLISESQQNGVLGVFKTASFGNDPES